MHYGFDRNDAAAPAAALPRMFSKPRDMRPQRLDLNMLIVQMTGTLEQVLGPEIALEVECEQNLPPILGVMNLMTLSLMDLCAIARAAMAKRGRLTIKTTVREIDQSRAGRPLETRVGQFVCLEVCHSGAGADAQPNGDSAENLATVYGIAQQHCGWLEVERSQEAISFNLYLPVAARAVVRSGNDEFPIEIPGGAETILLVEDEADLLDLTREILERYGYRIITAPNGVAALKIWTEHRDEINLLVTDMRMPEGINGYELAQRLVSDKPKLKVIYVSGYSLEPSAAFRLNEGENFLTKPYTPPGLAQAVRRMLDCSETAQAA